MTSNFKIFSSAQLKPTDITEASISLSAAKDNRGGLGKSVNIRYLGSTFSIQTPKMRSPFGLSKFDASKQAAFKGGQPQQTQQTQQTQESNQDGKWSLSLSFDVEGVKEDVLAKTTNFRDILEEFDQVILDKACSSDKNVTAWVGTKGGKPLSRDIIEDRREKGHSLHLGKTDATSGQTFPDTFRYKINEPMTAQGIPSKFPTTFFHHTDRTKPLVIDFNDPDAPNYATKVVPPNSYLISVAYASIWESSGKWGVRWVGQQVVVFPASAGPNLKICAIAVDPDEEEDPQDLDAAQEESPSVVVADTKNVTRGKSTVDPPTVDEEEDDADYEDEVAN